MKTYANALAARIAATNEAHRIAMELKRQLLPHVRAFVGKKIVTSGNSLVAAFEKNLPKEWMPGDRSVRIFRHTGSASSLDWMVDVSRQTGAGHAYYEKQYINLGEIKNQILISVNEEIPNLRTDYTEYEIIQLRKAANVAAEAARDAESACFPFGLVDR